MKKFLSNTIVQLLIAVIIGLLAGFVVNDAVLEVVICIKHITGQIIFFLVPLIILGFIAPSIAHLRSNASKMLLFAFSIAYLSSIGASFFGAAVGYNVIPFLHIADDASTRAVITFMTGGISIFSKFSGNAFSVLASSAICRKGITL